MLLEECPAARCPRHPCAAALAVCLALLVGCRPPEPSDAEPSQSAPAALAPIRVLVVDDAELAAAIQQQWQARAERDLELRQTDRDQLLAGDAARLGVDVVIYPSGLLGTLAERGLIESMDEEDLNDPQYARREIFQLERLSEVSWGRQTFAVCFGSPAFTLCYRRDLLEQLGCEPPGDWAEYAGLVRQLADRAKLGSLAPPADQPWHAVVEPLGPGWAGQLLLARAAAYARHRSQYSTLFEYRTMTPLIGGAPFVRALEELLEIAPYLPAEAGGWTPSDARRELLAGRCALAITWASRADDQSASELRPAVAFAELPGASQAYNYRSQQWEPRGGPDDQRVPLLSFSGRLGSVTRESRQQRVAAHFLVWLTGPLSSEVCVASKHTTLFRDSQLEQPERWVDAALDEQAAASYGRTVQDAKSRAAWLCSPRLPGRDRYLVALDEAVQAALAGKASAAEALQQTAARWEEITDALGRGQQRQAYMQSIGLEP